MRNYDIGLIYLITHFSLYSIVKSDFIELQTKWSSMHTALIG